MTNAEYVFGKTFGVFILFFSLNLFVLLIAFVFNFFFTDVPVVPMSYIYYPLFISIPTLTFIFGLSFLCMVILKSQAITFMLLLGYIATTLFIIGNKFHFLFDYMTFNVPLMYSDFIGFGDISSILIHRGLYLFLGIGFILMTVLFIKRLPQSRFMNRICLVLSLVCIVSALFLGQKYIARVKDGIDLRAEMRVLAQKYVELPKLSVTDMQLELIHNGDTIEVQTDVFFKNDTSSSIKSYIFSLNPDLVVHKVERDGISLSFHRDLHILDVNPDSILMPGKEDKISIFYSGSINEEANYTDISEELREEKYDIFVYNIDKRYGFLSPEYVLLTQENLWYPTSGVPFGSAYPKTQSRDFINFELTVKTNPALTAISQGSRRLKSESGEFIFKSEVPLPQLSLIIGKYDEKTISVEEMDYSIFVLEGHDYFSEFFPDIHETLPDILTEYKQDYERNLKLEYPYKRFSFVEVPIQFYSYDRLWTLNHETIQPEQILLPEKGILFLNVDFKRTLTNQSRRRGRNPRSPLEIQENMFRGFLRASIGGDAVMRRISRSLRSEISSNTFSLERMASSLLPYSIPSYDIFPNFYSFTNHFYSDEWPVFNISLENYLKSGIANNVFSTGNGLSNIEMANFELSKNTLMEIMEDPEKSDIAYDVLNNKVNYLFALIKAEIGEIEFEEFLYEFLLESRFKEMNAQVIIDRLKERFGYNLESYLDKWMNERRLPAFYFTDLDCIEILESDATRYYASFKVYNHESVSGVISASLSNVPEDQRDYYFYIEGNQAKEIGIVIDNAPRSIRFNTFIAQNLPVSINESFPKPELIKDAVIFEGERAISLTPTNAESYELISDNEDPGFEVHSQLTESLLMRMVNARNNSAKDEYVGFNYRRPPNSWKLTVQNDFYGLYKHTAYFTNSGDGEQKVIWHGEIPENGKYDIYYNTPESIRRIVGGSGRRRTNYLKDLNFKIYHDDGIDEVALNITETSIDWSFLGTYYLSEGIAKIELSNKSKGRVVYADAVKWSLRRE
ncbi:hypothetical protein ACFL6K_02265 [Candidatus Latescibacterota bacterium]